ncbi:hypothetical protein [Halopiger thermotolerans]
MSPPPAAALALLGIWVLAVFFVTNEAGYAQLRSDADGVVTVPESGHESDSATPEADADARADANWNDSSDETAPDPVSDAGQKQDSNPSPTVRSPADD